MLRYFGARSNTGCQFIIILGALHNNRKSCAGELRSFIADSAQKDPAVPALDQNIGDRLIENRAPGYSQQVILAFVTGVFCKIFVCKPFRLRQHRRCNLDGIIECKLSDRLRRRVGYWRETNRHDSARCDLDLDRKTRKELVEYLYLRVRQMSRLLRE